MTANSKGVPTLYQIQCERTLINHQSLYLILAVPITGIITAPSLQFVDTESEVLNRYAIFPRLSARQGTQAYSFNLSFINSVFK